VYDNVNRYSNSRLFNNLFGDSSYIVNYLRAIGYDLGQDVVQTGSNFGVAQKHKAPSLCHVGRGTMVSDGLSMVNLDVSSTSFVLRDCVVGPENFLGNNIIWPAGGRVGDNCLLATKVMIPTDGPVRENIGLLGSPAFEIPRSVRRDAQFDQYDDPDVRAERIRRKNRSNLRTMLLYLLSRWFVIIVSLTVMVRAIEDGDNLHVEAFAAATVGLTVFSVFYFVLVERCTLRFGRLSPQYCSIYDSYYWFHERYWKMNDFGYLELFNGTPFKRTVWRMLGVRVGKRLYDDGCAIVEKTLVQLGDDCTLGAASTLQSHSLEDGTFKSDYIRIGNRCTVGTNAFVHYGVDLGDDVVLGPESFLMKGEAPRPGSTWCGNPARELR
jgi:non-ribosomal peptide synthetase-like protein